VVVRKDLEPGLQMAQALHVAFVFAQEHPNETKQWMTDSNYIAALNSANEQELHQLIQEAMLQDILFSVFREPDINNEVTAIALAPGSKSKKLCAKLSLALKET
jgi:hypothetical protein